MNLCIDLKNSGHEKLLSQKINWQYVINCTTKSEYCKYMLYCFTSKGLLYTLLFINDCHNIGVNIS